MSAREDRSAGRIAQVATEKDLLLLHSDRDFDDIASVVPELQIF